MFNATEIVDFQALAELVELRMGVIKAVSSTTFTIFEPLLVPFEQAVNAIAPSAVAWANQNVKENLHTFSAKLPLMNPVHVLFAVIMYAVILLALFPIAKILGKHKYRWLGLIHNAFLFFLSLYMCTAIAITAVACGFSLWNNGVRGTTNDWRMAKLIWLFYVSKLPEFVDTFLMVLKHNYRQISFLHLYHHSTIFVIWYIVTLKAPGGEAYWSAMVNSGVHVVMYGYYFGTMLFTTGRIRNFLNKFKFFITKGQMLQFACNCVQSLYDLNIPVKPAYPTGLIHLLFWYMLTLLALFGNFLIRNSRKPRDAASPTSSSPSYSPVTSPTTKKKNQ